MPNEELNLINLINDIMNKVLQGILAVIITILIFWLCESVFVFLAFIAVVYIIFSLFTNKGKLDLDNLF